MLHYFFFLHFLFIYFFLLYLDYSAERRCNLTDIKNGAVLCSFPNKDDCNVVCNDNYIFNPLQKFPKSFNCADDSTILAAENSFFNQEPCLGLFCFVFFFSFFFFFLFIQNPSLLFNS